MVRSHFPMPRVALQPQTEALKDKPTYEKHVWILSSSCSFQVSCLLLGYLGMPTWFWKHTFVDRDANPNSMCKSIPKPRHFIVIISLKQIEEVQLLENIKQPLAMQNPITPLPPLPPPMESIRLLTGQRAPSHTMKNQKHMYMLSWALC